MFTLLDNQRCHLKVYSVLLFVFAFVCVHACGVYYIKCVHMHVCFVRVTFAYTLNL